MARKKTYGKEIAKLFLGVVLLILAVIGLSYGSLLKGMDQAAADYGRGDNEAALKKYETIDARVRGLGAIRIIPAKDRRNLILNESRLLYALGKYDEAMERMEAENTISGNTTDGRFLLLRGEIAFRKAVKNYRESAKKDPRVLEEQLRGCWTPVTRRCWRRLVACLRRCDWFGHLATLLMSAGPISDPGVKWTAGQRTKFVRPAFLQGNLVIQIQIGQLQLAQIRHGLGSRGIGS